MEIWRKKAGKEQKCGVVCGEVHVAKECLTFVAAVAKNWRSPVAEAA
jgi:hypothetical protein